MGPLDLFLHSLPGQAFGFMLVVARAGSAMLLGPGFGEAEIPSTVRAALAVLVSLLVYPLLQGQLPAVPVDVPTLVYDLALEALVGAWLGFMARLIVLALSVSGAVVSLMVGLSSVLQIDPSLGAQVPALQRLLGLAAVALLLSTGLYLLPVEAVMGSYDLIKPGGGFDAGGAADLVTRAVSGSFSLGVRLAAPFIVTCLVWQATMGLVSRVVPQIHVHVVAAPAQILGGLAMLSIVIAYMLSTWSSDASAVLSRLPGL